MLSDFSLTLFEHCVNRDVFEMELACLPFRLPAAGMPVADACYFDVPSWKAGTRHSCFCLAGERADLPAGDCCCRKDIFGLLPVDEAGNPALLDSELEATRGYHGELADIADDCGKSIAFERFFGCP